MRRHERSDQHPAKHDPSRNAAHLHAHETEWPDLRPSCTSQNRCSSISCERCAKRYGRRVARRILATNPRNLFGIEINAALSSLGAFWCWRIEVRNWVDHRRRVDRHWRSAGLYVWLSQDGWVRGVIALNALTTDEVEATLGRRWPITLRRVDQSVLCCHIYETIRPPAIWSDKRDQSRYQHRKLVIWQRRTPALIEPRVPPTKNNFIEPMPFLI
jgi:hypothetical protein